MGSGTRNSVIAAIAIAIAAAAYAGFGAPRSPRRPRRAGAGAGGATRGGELVASVRTEPRSFNRFVQRDSTTDLVSTLTQAKLVRINHVTQDVEPWLAEAGRAPTTAAATR